MLEKLQDFGLDTEKLVLIIFLIILAIVLYISRQYIKDSIRELKHVVWPTREETTNYFLTVVLVLLAFWIYLFIASTIFTKSLFGLKDFVDSKKTIITKKVEKNINNKKAISAKAKPTIKVKWVNIKTKDSTKKVGKEVKNQKETTK